MKNRALKRAGIRDMSDEYQYCIQNDSISCRAYCRTKKITNVFGSWYKRSKWRYGISKRSHIIRPDIDEDEYGRIKYDID